jgi:hypothetical protein
MTDHTATVVCRQLGLTTNLATARHVQAFGGTVQPQCMASLRSTPINADDVRCAGTESSFESCPQRTAGHNCGHYEDAGICCNNA